MKVTNIGDRISIARKAAKLTQPEVAELTGYSTNTINRLEKSHSIPDLTQITKIGDVTQCDLFWLITGVDSSSRAQQDTLPIYKASQVTADRQPTAAEAQGRFAYTGLGDFDFVVINDSPAMAPRLLEGCLMPIRIGGVNDGEIAALIDEWGSFQVRWQRRVVDRVVYVAENQGYQPLQADKVKLIGRVVASVQISMY